MDLGASTYRMVALTLGVALIICVVGIIVLAALSKDIPDPLKIIASSDLTGLIGLLVHPSKEDGA